MDSYLNMIITNEAFDKECHRQAIAVPRTGDQVTVRDGDTLVEEFGGVVTNVHWDFRKGFSGTVVTVTLKEDNLK